MQYKVKGAVVCHSLEEALKALKDYDEDDIYIIGGESIYRQFLPYCTTAHVTSIDYTYDGDAYFLIGRGRGMVSGGRGGRADLF